MMDLDLARLVALSAAVSEGTFDAAAATLHVTPSAISQRIKALEVSVGQVLLTRTKPIRPTPAGRSLVRLAHQIKLMQTEVAAELGGAGELGGAADAGPTTVALAINADSLATWVLPALAEVGAGAVFDIHREDQERTADLLRDGSVMAAVTSSAQAVPGCTVERLGGMRYRPMATPAFIARWFADGATAAALALAPVVVFDRADQLQARYLRRRTRGRANPPRHHIPASAEFVEAIGLGLGWGMLPDLQTMAAPYRDDLVEIDSRGAITVDLYWQQWALRSTTLDQVATAIRSAAAHRLR
jgi:LysR family transcriptional regulator, chromosome initiation inhibitor